MLSKLSFDPVAWMAGLLGMATIAWAGTTSKKVNDHSVKIAVILEQQDHIKASLDRIEDALLIVRGGPTGRKE